jgi:hypothetical protein
MAVDCLIHKKAFMAVYFLILKEDPEDMLAGLSLCMWEIVTGIGLLFT